MLMCSGEVIHLSLHNVRSGNETILHVLKLCSIQFKPLHELSTKSDYILDLEHYFTYFFFFTFEQIII